MTFGGTVTIAANAFRVTDEWIESTNSDPNSMDPLSPYDVGAILLDPTAASQVANLPAAVSHDLMADLMNVGVAVTGYPASALGPSTGARAWPWTWEARTTDTAWPTAPTAFRE